MKGRDLLTAGDRDIFIAIMRYQFGSVRGTCGQREPTQMSLLSSCGIFEPVLYKHVAPLALIDCYPGLNRGDFR